MYFVVCSYCAVLCCAVDVDGCSMARHGMAWQEAGDCRVQSAACRAHSGMFQGARAETGRRKPFRRPRALALPFPDEEAVGSDR